MINESNPHIRNKFFAWAKEYGVDAASHEKWNEFLSVWNLRDAEIERLNGLVAMQAEAFERIRVKNDSGHLDSCILDDMLKEALSASSDTVSAWTNKDVERLSMEVAELKMELDCCKNRVCSEIATLSAASSDLLDKINQNIPISEIESSETNLRNVLLEIESASELRAKGE